MVVSEEGRLLILEDPSDEELSRVKDHDGPVIIVLRKLGNVNVQGKHPMNIYILRSPSNEELEALKAQLMARRVTTKEVAVEGPISRRELLMGRVTKVVEKNIPTYFENACRARFGCGECVNACPANAISIVNNRVTINESACIECGLCVSRCPTGALAMVGADDNEYVALLNKLNNVRGIRRITFTCPLNTRESRDGEYIYRVPCIDSVSPEWVAMALAKSLEVGVECPDQSCKLGGADYAKGLINAFTESFKLSITEDGALSMIGGEEVGEGMIYMGIRRNDYIKALTRLRPRTTGVANELLKIFSVHVDDVKCSFCGVCFAKCPERAFDVGRDGNKTVLKLNNLKCIGCGYCARLCPEKAITVDRAKEFPMSDSTDVVYDEVITCKMCGRPFDTRRHIMATKVRLGIKGDPEWLYLCPDCRRYYTAKRMLENALGMKGVKSYI
ncbi:4Fe-4S ferredoxin iron-sulfur binding domain protein [Vulcanisaeta distributa DSM 14429]|uniref:4Fe-4S ferredoxin iron-sulfur binding domain protein n=2 Tax=Vulcanisaeta distributa TaxID=164451 RepID=E1QPX2_VULDI|nr:4Fe-4S ferredoxin iron-sulfur binding domain protein [Vulcanisaeta distributa DSM 14429]